MRCAVMAGAMAVLAVMASTSVVETAIAPSLEDLVLVSDDDAAQDPGCDAVSALDAVTGRVIARGERIVSPGRMATNSDATLVVSVSNNSSFTRGNPFVYTFWRQSNESSKWHSDVLFMSVLMGAQPAISPDDKALLLPMAQGVDKYDISSAPGRSLGQRVGSYAHAHVAALEFSPDSRTAYVVGSEGQIHIVDVATMTRRGSTIPYSPVGGRVDRRIRNTNAAVSPDGRFLAINTGDRGELNVIDLTAGASQVVSARGLDETWDLSFNYAESEGTLLAVHGRTEVAVYDFKGLNDLDLIASASVPGQRFSAWSSLPGWATWARVASLAWSGRGDSVIAAIGSKREYRVLEFSADNGTLERRLDFHSCEYEEGAMLQLDVLTLNDRLAPPPTPTVTPCPTPSPTMTAVATSTPSPTATPSSTPTITDTAIPTPTATRVLQPVYLPLLLKEECDPTQLQADVALVIDASTSMLEETRAERTKLAAAVEAVELFLGEMNLPLDQAAIVQFNSDVALLQGLTGDRSALVDSLNRLQVQRQTRIDLGIQVAREELKSARRRPGNQAVMIVLTDGRANPVGPDAAVREADRSRDEGVIVFTIGLGEDLDLAALEAMASKPSYFYRAPDAEDLARAYSMIAVEIPCTTENYWGRR